MKMTKRFTGKNLIALGEIERSSHSVVTAVREALGSLDEKLAVHSNGKIQSVEDRRLGYVRWISETANPQNPQGFGYLASSLEYDAEKETLWAGVAVDAFQKAGFHPLVLPIDDFYRYIPDSWRLMCPHTSLTFKVRQLSAEKMYDKQKKPYALVLTGFTQSKVFSATTINEIPHQDDAGFLYSHYTPFAKSLYDFSKNKFPLLLVHEHGSLQNLLFSFAQKISGVREEDIRLLAATALMLADGQSWQSLWHVGIPLYVVAPKPFHDAMNRLNFCWGHGAMDYQYRAMHSLRANNYPIFEVIDGKFKTESDFRKEFNLENYIASPDPRMKGLDAKEFEQRLNPLVEQFS